jgi:uncharacterized protein with PQ loop repeat
MNPRRRAFIQALVLVGVVVALFLIFPGALKFAEMGARELRYFWWLILLVALALWLIWGFKKRP